MNEKATQLQGFQRDSKMAISKRQKELNKKILSFINLVEYNNITDSKSQSWIDGFNYMIQRMFNCVDNKKTWDFILGRLEYESEKFKTKESPTDFSYGMKFVCDYFLGEETGLQKPKSALAVDLGNSFED
jgi:hypothetical protein